MHLLQLQRNEVFRLIQDAAADIRDFKWEAGAGYERVIHRRSDFHFTFGGARPNQFMSWLSVVTVKDRHGCSSATRQLASGAKVRAITKNPRAKRTNIRGQSGFVPRVRNRSFGKRLRLVIVAKTPQAKQRKASSVRIPRLAKRLAARRR